MKIMKSRQVQRRDQKKTKTVFVRIECKKSRKSITNKSKQANKQTSEQGKYEETTRRVEREPVGKQEEGKATTRIKKRASNKDKHAKKIQTSNKEKMRRRQ